MNRPIAPRFGFVTLAFLAACSSNELSIQTAIAQTQEAQLAQSPSSTPVPLSQLNLESLLIQDGDLPTIFLGQQVVSRPPVDIAAVPPADQAINREFRAGEFASDGVTILLYEFISDIETAYGVVVRVISEGTTTRAVTQLGEKAVVTEETIGGIPMVAGVSIPSATSAKVVFIRCHAIVYIDLFASEADAEVAVAYAMRIDQRIQALVCN